MAWTSPINFHSKSGFCWIDAPVLADPSVKALHDAHGDVGVMYVLLFGHPWSEFFRGYALDERESKVIEEIHRLNVGKNVRERKLVTDFYQTKLYEDASIALNNMACTPDWRYRVQLETQEQSYSKQLSESTNRPPELDSKNKIDFERQEKRLKYEQSLMKTLAQIREEIRKEDMHSNAITSSNGMITMQDAMMATNK